MRSINAGEGDLVASEVSDVSLPEKNDNTLVASITRLAAKIHPIRNHAATAAMPSMIITIHFRRLLFSLGALVGWITAFLPVIGLVMEQVVVEVLFNSIEREQKSANSQQNASNHPKQEEQSPNQG